MTVMVRWWQAAAGSLFACAGGFVAGAGGADPLIWVALIVCTVGALMLGYLIGSADLEPEDVTADGLHALGALYGDRAYGPTGERHAIVTRPDDDLPPASGETWKPRYPHR